MIYPDQYKCLTCKFRYYGCKHRKDKNMLSCDAYVYKKFPQAKKWSPALHRCLFGVCPAVLAFKLQQSPLLLNKC